MPGPNSAPNGDAALVHDVARVHCYTHGRASAECGATCRRVRHREWLARKGTLRTGKTAAKRK